MSAFVPPDGITFREAFHVAHLRLFGGEYEADLAEAEHRQLAFLRRQLESEASDERKQGIKCELGPLVSRRDRRADQRRAVLRWLHGQLWNGAPPTRFLLRNGEIFALPARVWARPDFMADRFSSDFARLPYRGVMTVEGMVHFGKEDLDRAISWALGQPDPLKAHAAWDTILAEPAEPTRSGAAPPRPPPSGRAKFARENKKGWLAEQLGGSLEGPPRRTAEYKRLAAKLAAENGSEVTDEDIQVEANRLRSLHRNYM